jgi:hypothetical protein
MATAADTAMMRACIAHAVEHEWADGVALIQCATAAVRAKLGTVQIVSLALGDADSPAEAALWAPPLTVITQLLASVPDGRQMPTRSLVEGLLSTAASGRDRLRLARNTIDILVSMMVPPTEVVTVTEIFTVGKR